MRLRNNIFAEAFKWLKKNWEGIRYQKDLASKIGVSEDTITRIMRDQTEVTDDFLCKFNEAFDNIFNYQWLRGEDPIHMLTIDLINAQKERIEPQQTTHIDEGSMINMTISAQMGYIESLKQQVEDARADLEREKKSASELIERERRNADERISDLKSQIDDLHAQLADKDIVIAEQKQRLRDYRHIIDTNNLLDKGYPFPIGAADGDMRQPKRK